MAYTAPGIYTESVRGPQVGINSNTPNALGIIGTSVRQRSGSQRIVLTGTTDTVLDQKGIVASSIAVRNVLTGDAYALSTGSNNDYVVTVTSGSDGQAGTYDDVTAIKRTAGSTIPTGVSVDVSYQFSDSDYFKPHEFFDYDDVRDFYGDAFDGNGGVQSGITLSAQIAFANGVGRVICVTPEHSGAGLPNAAEYTTALDRMANEFGISIITTDSGLSAFHASILAHCINQSNSQRERRAIVGYDGSVTAVPTATRQANAKSLKNSRIAAISPATVGFFVQNLNKEVIIGGQYLAVAVGASALANPASTPLTRNRIYGFTSLPETVGEGVKSAETEAGLLVVESDIDGNLRVRHGVTTDPVTTESREWSILSQQDALVYRIRAYLDAAQLIGAVITDTTLASVKGTVDAALQRLLLDETILDYQNLKARQLADPVDTVEVRFDWRPSMPMNYIVVRFSIDLSTGDVTSTGN